MAEQPKDKDKDKGLTSPPAGPTSPPVTGGPSRTGPTEGQPQVVPGDLPQGTAPIDQIAENPEDTAEAMSLALAQIKAQSDEPDDDDLSSFTPPERPTAGAAAGSTTRPGGGFWIGNRLVDAEGRTLKVHTAAKSGKK
jgi:hypothetical protein